MQAFQNANHYRDEEDYYYINIICQGTALLNPKFAKEGVSRLNDLLKDHLGHMQY